jgi:Domain of unknown function (DUF4349)/Putative zinc-finger
MATIHDEIDNWLPADLHDQLSEEERNALHIHLVECVACRRAHQENKIMNTILEDTLATEKPDPAFEQRMLGRFRRRVPEKTRIANFIAGLMRLRAPQLAGVAFILLVLVQVGRMLTGEASRPSRAFQVASATDQLSALLNKKQAGPMGGARSYASPRDNTFDIASSSQNAESSVAASMAATPAPQARAQLEFHEETMPATPAAKGAALENNREASEVAVAENPQTVAPAPVAPELANRKLIRNANVEIEIADFDEAVQKITVFANEDHGYVATTSSKKQENGKLKGEVVVKVLPENLDRFLQKVRSLGELKNQTIGTEDVTKAYFDTDARLKNAHVMEQRLIDMLETKTGKVSDLLQVEKELGRVREEIEKMQGELKYWDSEVQFATVTISLAEKDLEEPAAFLLKERTQVALYVNDVEKIYNDLKTLASPKVQITTAQLNRDNVGRVAAHLSMLLVPEESDAVVSRVKGMGRVENFQVQTERVAQGGNPAAAGSENAKTKRDKVELNITISRETDEQAVQETSLRILTSDVDQKAAQLKNDAAKSGAEIRSSTFSRDPDGREVADISVRVAMKTYATMMKSLNQLGELKDVSVQRRDKIGKNTPEEKAPADISIQIYSRGNIVSSDTGPFATLRNTVAQGAVALMWSLRMIGVAIAFLAPWAIALVGVIWIARRIARARNKT